MVMGLVKTTTEKIRRPINNRTEKEKEKNRDLNSIYILVRDQLNFAILLNPFLYPRARAL
jgi:hypothetical protein